MKAVVITIGDELLIGQIVNTNSAWLSEKLFALGISVERHIVIADDEKQILSEFKSAFNNYNVIIVTGGLGPTHDDITKKCITKFFKSKMVLDVNTLKHVKNIFKRRGLQMADNNICQALIPDVSVALQNAHGTAPGILIDKGGRVFCAMPGVPYEMKYISETGLFPYLIKKFKKKTKKVLLQKTLHTIGVSESLLSQKMGDINSVLKSPRGSSAKLAFLPRPFEVRLRINVEAKNKLSASHLIASVEKRIKSKVGKHIYSYNEHPIEKVVGDLLKRKKLTLSVAESCTGGLISSMITDIPGSSAYFIDGVVSYSNETKMKFLGVNESTLIAHGAVSPQTAREMAVDVRKRSGTDIGISTTGIAGPTGATKTKPVGLVYIGYSDKSSSFALKFILTKDRLRNKEMASKMALEIVRRKLLKIKND